MKFTTCLCLAALALFPAKLTADIVVTTARIDGEDAAFGADASDSDLVNDDATSLSGVEFSATPFFGPDAHNDGTVGAANQTGDILFWLSAAAGSTYSITYTLDTTVHPGGYDLTSIRTIHGWTNGSGYQKNQTYEVLVSLVGDPDFDSLTTVAYSPYGPETNVASTKVDINEDAIGRLASGVDAVRFTYTVGPAPTGSNPSPTIREIDVFGAPTSTGPDNTAPQISSLTPPDDAPSVSPAEDLSVTFDEVVKSGSGDITIRNLDLDSETVIPISDSRISVSGSTLVIDPTADLTPDTDYAIRISATAIVDLAGNSFAGILDDTIWNFHTGTTPLVVSAPVTRQVVQRDGSNRGVIPVAGSLGGSVDRVEARAVAPFAAPPWQTIATNPSGSFNGALTEVVAGGWYEVQVRTILNETPVETLTIDKIGVGDVYVTCGQSNSANFGSPAGTVEDDRVSAWDHFTGAWTKAADPMPGASGGGGSVWTRLGDLLAARDDVPIAFACLGVGGTRVDQWVPPGGNYPRVKTAMEAFPVEGFRAVLWHQGESDALASTNPVSYQSRLESIIAQSRLEAGWAVPWYIAEAAFHPSSNLSQEEPVVAGQRRAIFNDPLVIAGPVTDDFHLEGKLSDGVHFNGAGLADHAAQWAAVLGGTPVLDPKNGDFEANPPLADGATAAIDPSLSSSPSVIGWRALGASGEAVPKGSWGTFNPDDSTYSSAGDRGADGGVLPGMAGRHVAFLSGFSVGTHFLQTRRAMAEASTTYTLTVALGVRNDPADFGSARLEILRNGVVAAGARFDKAALDTLRGGDSAGTFTDASVSWTSSAAVEDKQALAIRIVKQDGAGTVLDFDRVRFSAETVNDFSSWISDPTFGLALSERGFDLDPDHDGLPNGVEAWFGTDPGQPDSGWISLLTDGTTTSMNHPHNEAPLAGLSGFYQWSPNLENWYDSGNGPVGEATVTFSSVSSGGTTTVSVDTSEPLECLFLRVCAVQN